MRPDRCFLIVCFAIYCIGCSDTGSPESTGFQDSYESGSGTGSGVPELTTKSENEDLEVFDSREIEEFALKSDDLKRIQFYTDSQATILTKIEKTVDPKKLRDGALVKEIHEHRDIIEIPPFTPMVCSGLSDHDNDHWELEMELEDFELEFWAEKNKGDRFELLKYRDNDNDDARLKVWVWFGDNGEYYQVDTRDNDGDIHEDATVLLKFRREDLHNLTQSRRKAKGRTVDSNDAK